MNLCNICKNKESMKFGKGFICKECYVWEYSTHLPKEELLELIRNKLIASQVMKDRDTSTQMSDA